MSTSGLLVMLLSLILGHVSYVSAQVSFSTHWGSGKRANMFKSQPETSQEQSMFDTPAENMPQFFGNGNTEEILQCFTRLEMNIVKYMALILEKEIKQAKKCVLDETGVEFDLH